MDEPLATLNWLVEAGADEALAQRLLHKSEQGCLVANSLNGTRSLVAQIRFL